MSAPAHQIDSLPITRAMCRALGICIVCLREDAREGLTSCQACADRHVDFLRRQRARRIDAGLCTRCGRRDAAPDRLMCEDCGEKNRATVNRLRRK